jgi:serine/threonine protein phosphatase PrpC
MIESFGFSDTGPVRSNNEDCFLTDDELSLFVVADGMGGHAAGEVASRLAVEAIENFIRRSQEPGDFSWPCGIDPTLSFAGNRLRTAIYLANRRVYRVAEGHDDYTGMGTTVVCALMHGAGLAIGHVGDSRLYLLTDGALSPLTRDDTWAATVLAGDDDPSRVADHPMRNVLTNVLGAREQTEIHLSERILAHGEMLLLCSDGVHNAIDDMALRHLLVRDAPLEDIARSVVAAALDGGSRDNVTALVVRYLDGAHGT